MDTIDIKGRASRPHKFFTYADVLQVTPKTSSSWISDLNRPQETTGTRIDRNTADYKFFKEAFSSYLAESDSPLETKDIPSWMSKNVVFSSESSATENDLNTARLDDFRQRFTSELIQALKQESVEPGVIGQADMIVTSCLEKNRVATMSWINELFLDNFGHPSIAADLLLLVGRMSYEVARPTGVTMAISGLTHKNSAVQEAAIRAFENWAVPDCLEVLEKIDVQHKWLKEYVQDVISDLKVIYG